MRQFISRTLVIFLVLSVLYGCAAARPEHLPEALNGRSVVVLSTVGDTMNLMHVGTTVFQNTQASVDVARWRLDAYLEEHVLQVLERDGRFRPRIATDPQSREIMMGVGYDAGNTPIYAIKERKGKTKRVAALEKADLVLLLAPDNEGDVFFGTNQSMDGYGVYQRSFLGVKTKHVVYATLQMVLYDGQTGDEITWASDYEGQMRVGELWPAKSEGSLSEQQLNETMREIFGDYDKLMSHKLRKMSLSRQ